MTFEKLNNFEELLKQTIKDNDPETQALAENFILEERITKEREKGYSEYIESALDFDQWNHNHEEYVLERINLDKTDTKPVETFTDHNKLNIFKQIEPDQYLVRLERIEFPARGIMREGIDQVVDYFDDFIKTPEQSQPADFIENFLEKWNDKRDLRPVFAGFWGEVKQFFVDPYHNQIQNRDWANQLRDLFGLGHLDPSGGEPIPVVLFRYRVKDVLDANTDGKNIVAVPTVLDGGFSPFFYPTPLKGWTEGQTVDLTQGDENNYSLNCEIIHRYIPYKKEFIYNLSFAF
jgi:hypothetical protein